MHPAAPEDDDVQGKSSTVAVLVVGAMITAALCATAVSVGTRDMRVDALQLLASAGGCAQCGVVVSVEALGASRLNRDADRYRLNVRMGDGSVRTVEQRVALLKGSRVVIEGGLVRPAPDPTARG